jgi:hypothetical protein
MHKKRINGTIIMESKISTILGGITGTYVAFQSNIGSALIVAFLTGGAAYMGQQLAKHVQSYIKKKFKK